MGQTKQEKRERMLKHLNEFSKEEHAEISTQLQERLFASPLWQKAEVIGIYLSMDVEWDTLAIVARAFEEGKRVAIPKVFPETKEMFFYELTALSDVVVGHFGIREPDVEIAQEMDKDLLSLMIVPGVVFSKDGYRIGFGGGYYDRFLADFIHPTVSLVHSSQLVQDLPIDHFDIPVHYLFTEDGLL